MLNVLSVTRSHPPLDALWFRQEITSLWVPVSCCVELVLCIFSHLGLGADLWGRKGWEYPFHCTERATGARQTGRTFLGLPRKRMRVHPALHMISPRSGPAGLWSSEMNPGASYCSHWQKHAGSQRFSVISTKSMSCLLWWSRLTLFTSHCSFPPRVCFSLMCPHILVSCFPGLDLPPPSFPSHVLAPSLSWETPAL